jgi:hypothetical protein
MHLPCSSKVMTIVAETGFAESVVFVAVPTNANGRAALADAPKMKSARKAQQIGRIMTPPRMNPDHILP